MLEHGKCCSTGRWWCGKSMFALAPHSPVGEKCSDCITTLLYDCPKSMCHSCDAKLQRFQNGWMSHRSRVEGCATTEATVLFARDPTEMANGSILFSVLLLGGVDEWRSICAWRIFNEKMYNNWKGKFAKLFGVDGRNEGNRWGFAARKCCYGCLSPNDAWNLWEFDGSLVQLQLILMANSTATGEFMINE